MWHAVTKTPGVNPQHSLVSGKESQSTTLCQDLPDLVNLHSKGVWLVLTLCELCQSVNTSNCTNWHKTKSWQFRHMTSMTPVPNWPHLKVPQDHKTPKYRWVRNTNIPMIQTKKLHTASQTPTKALLLTPCHGTHFNLASYSLANSTLTRPRQNGTLFAGSGSWGVGRMLSHQSNHIRPQKP